MAHPIRGTVSLLPPLHGTPTLRLTGSRPDGLADDVALTWILMYAAHLSGFVFEAFGLPRAVMDNVLWRCIDLFEAADDDHDLEEGR